MLSLRLYVTPSELLRIEMPTRIPENFRQKSSKNAAYNKGFGDGHNVEQERKIVKAESGRATGKQAASQRQ
jgi:hypothetical protein